MPTDLLLIANTPSPNTIALASAVERGANAASGGKINTTHLAPTAANADNVLATRAIIIGTTENFGYMSGQIKDFFERIYYPCLEKTAALPWALYIRAGKDGTGTNRAVHAIVGGMRWKEVQPPLLLVGDYQNDFIRQCEELGMTMAASLEVGLF